MSGAHHLIADPHRIVHETIAGETIVIDLDTGTYFSLTGSGPEIWELLIGGHPPDRVVKAMVGRYRDDAERVASLTAELIDRLCREDLLVEGSPGQDVPAAAVQTEAPPAAGFVAPVLESFTDMQHFLMLDPIHEVRDGGWPHAPAPPQGAA